MRNLLRHRLTVFPGKNDSANNLEGSLTGDRTWVYKWSGTEGRGKQVSGYVQNKPIADGNALLGAVRPQSEVKTGPLKDIWRQLAK